MGKAKASNLTVDDASTGFGFEVADSPPHSRGSPPCKSNASNEHVNDSTPENNNASNVSVEHKTPSLEESSIHSQNNAEREKSFIMMVHNMLRKAGPKKKEEFAQGFIADQPDSKLQKIYSIETSRSQDEVDRVRTASWSTDPQNDEGDLETKSKGTTDSRAIGGDDSIVSDLPNSKWFPTFDTPALADRRAVPPDPPSTDDGKDADDSCPPGFRGYVVSGHVLVPEGPPGLTSDELRLRPSHDVENQGTTRQSIVLENEQPGWLGSFLSAFSTVPVATTRLSTALRRMRKDEGKTIPETPGDGLFANSTTDTEGEEGIEVASPRKKSMKFGLMHFVILLVFLVAAIAGLSYYVWSLGHDGQSSKELVVASDSPTLSVSPTAVPSVSPTTSAPSLSVSPTMSAQPTPGPTQTPSSQPSSLPTRSPTIAPSVAPTSHPTVETEEMYFMNLMAKISPTVAMKMEDRDSNHFRALQWLANDPDFFSYNDERLVQRWVLTFFNYETRINAPPTPEPTGEPSISPTGLPSSSPTTGAPSLVPSLVPSGSPTEALDDKPTLDPFPGRQLTNWNAMKSWSKYTDECQWFSSYFFNRVACTRGKTFKRFLLINLGLEGTIPSELALLSNLEVFAVPLNNLRGTIPPELGSLDSLRIFNVSYNQMEGTIPGSLRPLEILDVGNNLFHGPVPSEVCSMDLDIFRGDCEELDCTCCTRCAVPNSTEDIVIGN